MNIQRLIAIAKGVAIPNELSRVQAINRLAASGSNASIQMLVELLTDDPVGLSVSEALSTVIVDLDTYKKIVELYHSENPHATQLLKSWRDYSWLRQFKSLVSQHSCLVYKVVGTLTADMLSPASAAWSRKEPALHAQSFLSDCLPNAVEELKALKSLGYPIAFIADKVFFNDARQAQYEAAIQSLLWHIEGKYTGLGRGIFLTRESDETFRNLAEQKGLLVLEADITPLHTKDLITIDPCLNRVQFPSGQYTDFRTSKGNSYSIWQVGGRVNFELGMSLSYRSQQLLEKREKGDVVLQTPVKKQYTLIEKLIGKACGVAGMASGTICSPFIATVEISHVYSEHTEGIQNFSWQHTNADLVVTSQSIAQTEALVLKPNDGQTHAWIHRLLLPDTLYLSHYPNKAHPLGVNLARVTSQVYEAAKTGSVFIRVPTSIKIKLYGEPLAFISISDLAHAVYDLALKKIIHLEPKPILEIEGFERFSVDALYELTEIIASYGFSVILPLSITGVRRALEYNLMWGKRLLDFRFKESNALKCRLLAMKSWLKAPTLLQSDPDATYAHTLAIDAATIIEPLLISITDHKQVSTLSALASQAKPISDVWIGPGALDLSHYRIVASLLKAYPTPLKAKLWIVPPSPFEVKELMKEGCYRVYGQAGVRTEMPENEWCSRKRFSPNSRVVATNYGNFSTMQRKQLKGYVGSPEVGTLAAILGRLPTLQEYLTMRAVLYV